MSKDTEQDYGIIPAGTRVKLFEGRVTLLEDVAVDADQEWIDKAIKDQEDYFNGINSVCTGEAIGCSSPQLEEVEIKAVERVGIALQAASFLEVYSCKHHNQLESSQD